VGGQQHAGAHHVHVREVGREPCRRIERLARRRAVTRGIGQSADAREGVSSFLDKRRPVYADKVSSGMPAFFPWWDEPPFE